MPVDLDDVRRAAAAVAASARWVHVDPDRAAAFAVGLGEDLTPPATLVSPACPRSDEDRAAWVLALDAVNFGSGWFPVLRKRPGLSGARTVAAALADRFDGAGPLSAGELRAATTESVAAIFGQDAAGPAGELMVLFARAWRELGELVAGRYGGSFLALVEEAAGSAERLVALVDELAMFHDVASYRGAPVPLWKRAQLTAADLALELGGRPPAAFGDLDRLTMFADNLVPHVLRLEGVLVYDRELVERIESEALIGAGSEEETEIRAVAVHAVELVVAARRRAGLAGNAMAVDNLLWGRGQEPRFKAAPRHRARSICY